MTDRSNRAMSEELMAAEDAVSAAKLKVLELRRKIPREPVKDYVLKTVEGEDIRMSELFGDKSDLILIHNMGKRCPYCTLWADGLNGMTQHFESRAGFALISPDEPSVVKDFSEGRGWRFTSLSSHGTTFTEDLGFENEKGGALPGFSTFNRTEDGSIYRIDRSFFGPGDDYCAIWHMFDLLADGADGWEPRFSY